MRAELGEYIRRITTVALPSAPNVPIIDYEVKICNFFVFGTLLTKYVNCIITLSVEQMNYHAGSFLIVLI